MAQSTPYFAVTTHRHPGSVVLALFQHAIDINYRHFKKFKIMKKTIILYRIFTGLFALMMLLSSIPDILSSPVAVAGIGRLGYPAYFVPYIGIAKFLGVVAIVVPGFPRLKEWAYAGLCFDLISAFYSLIASGQTVGNWAFMILPLALAATSYIFYQKKIKLQLQLKTTPYTPTSFAKPVLQ